MARLYAMADLRKRVQRRADKEGDPQVKNPEWNALISEAYGELYNIASETGMEHFETAAQLTTTGVNYVSTPSDLQSLVLIAYVVDATTNRYVALRELMAQERTMMSGLNLTAGSRARGYALVADKIYLYPTPPSGQVYEVRYVPQAPDLDAYTDNQTVDVISPNGLAFLIWNAAIMAMSKSEADVTLAVQRTNEARERFMNDCIQRSLNTPRRRILDVESQGGYGEDWWGFGPWGD